MTRKWSSWVRRPTWIAGLAVAAVVAVAAPAAAHTPVILNNSDRLPWTGPLAVDGADPIAFFGALPRPFQDRAFQFQMQAGEPITIIYLIPDEAPENQLPTHALPAVTLLTPDGKVVPITPAMRVPVPIAELNENYILLNQYTATAVTGTYSVIVTGAAPARFNISIGTEGGPFHGIERGTVATNSQIETWYATPPTEQTSSVIARR